MTMKELLVEDREGQPVLWAENNMLYDSNDCLEMTDSIEAETAWWLNTTDPYGETDPDLIHVNVEYTDCEWEAAN